MIILDICSQLPCLSISTKGSGAVAAAKDITNTATPLTPGVRSEMCAYDLTRSSKASKCC
eukprot:6224668-Pyramimonas_sp.AAC.1